MIASRGSMCSDYPPTQVIVRSNPHNVIENYANYNYFLIRSLFYYQKNCEPGK